MAELFQVEFKGSRKGYFYNSYYHSLKVNDFVITQMDEGEHIGRLIRRLEELPNISSKQRPGSILRPAGDEDCQRLDKIRADEVRFRGEVIDLVARHGLPMKIVDVECQFDGNKMTVYFTADHRVDFRALVRDMASRYRTRIELRQIGVRDEAQRRDGYGICGRRQCCNSHLTEFAPVSTQHAREQDLSLNPAKISGNCGRLLCCLRYELEMYQETKKKFPAVGTTVKTEKCSGSVERIDIFKEVAVVRCEDDTFVTVEPSEIVGQGGKRPRRKADKEQSEAADSEELKKLDDKTKD